MNALYNFTSNAYKVMNIFDLSVVVIFFFYVCLKADGIMRIHEKLSLKKTKVFQIKGWDSNANTFHKFRNHK